MHVPRLVFWLILLLAAGCGNQTSPNNIESFLQSGYQYLEQGQFRAALIESQNVLKQDAQSEKARVLAGRIYLELGQPNETLRFLEEIEGSTPDYYQTLVEAYIERRKFQSALNVLNQQASLFEANPTAHKLLTAEARRGLQELDEAQTLYEEVLARDEGNVRARLGLASLQAIRGNLEQAEQDVNATLEIAPAEIDALLLRSVIHLRRGELEDAEASLTEAVSALPTTDIFTAQRARLLRALVNLLSRQGRSGEALVYQQMLAEAFPEAQEREEQLLAAIDDIREGNLEQAETALTELDEHSTTNETTGYLLGMINYVQGETEEADKYFSQSIDPEIAPSSALKYMALNLYRMNRLGQVVDMLESEAQSTDDPQLLAIYGVAAINANREDEGIKALRRALSLDPDNGRLFLVLAQHYNNLNPPQYEQALSELQAALSRSPDSLQVQAMYLDQLVNMERIEAAREFIDERLAEKSTPTTHQLAGAFYLQIEELPAAIEHFKRAAELDPAAKAAHVGLAKSLMATEQWEKARAAYRKVTELDPDDIEAYRGLMEAYRADDLGAEGLEELQAMADNHDNNVAAAAITEYLADRNEWGEAESRLEQITARAPDSPQTRRLNAAVNYRRAVTALRDDDYDTARTAVFKALNSYPTNQQLLRLLARIEMRAGQYNEAGKVVREIEKTYPDSRLTKILVADLAASQGEYSKALEGYQQAWQEQPDNNLGGKIFQAYVDAGKTEEAEAFSYEWQSALPDTAVLAVVNRAGLYDDDKDRAIETYETAPETLRESAVALNNLAWLYYETGQHDKGIVIAQRARQLAPNNPAIMDTYGWLLLENGEHKKAVEILQEAVRLAPDQPDIREHLRLARNRSSG